MMFQLSIICPRCRSVFEVLANLEETSGFSCPICDELVLRVEKIRGFVYILSNETMPDIVKIGFTERTVAERIAELSAHTGVAAPFKEEASFPVADPRGVEELIHVKLSGWRLRESREFFTLSPSDAIAAVRVALGLKSATPAPAPAAPQMPELPIGESRKTAAEQIAAALKAQGENLGGFGSARYETRDGTDR
jgi:predicted RNA-binding Zn-ribbon protein involved in translation (DUF1610 family)